MNPGRELDFLIAEKVMELKVVASVSDDKRKRIFRGPFGDDPWWTEDESGSPDYIRRYSTDIADAWEVRKKTIHIPWKDDPNAFLVICGANGKEWVHYENLTTGAIYGRIDGESAPHAICLGALEAIKNTSPKS